MVSMEAQLAEIAELRAQLARLPDLEDRKLTEELQNSEPKSDGRTLLQKKHMLSTIFPL